MEEGGGQLAIEGNLFPTILDTCTDTDTIEGTASEWFTSLAAVCRLLWRSCGFNLDYICLDRQPIG